jgi:hypothetical protein
MKKQENIGNLCHFSLNTSTTTTTTFTFFHPHKIRDELMYRTS